MTWFSLSVSLGISVFLLRRTDALFWYARIFGLEKPAYLRARRDGKNYLEWLNEQHDNFWTELLVCPFCLSTWLCWLPVGLYGLDCGPWSWLVIVATYSLLAFLKKALQVWS